MKILLAEDEKQLSRVLIMAMKSVGYDVDLVFNGQEAVEHAQANAYDVMIFDIMMPVKTGLEALKEIRATSDRTYVIMLTAMAEIDDKVTGLDAGADDYLTKPFSLKELLAQLRSLERRTEEYDSDVLAFGDLKVDQSEQRLASHNSMSLSGKETRLLSYFILNADKELSTQQLLNQAWDSDENADAEDVWIYISYLRQKLQAVGSSTIIDGQKGGPYQLSQPA